jgi:hypothetical protein
MKKMLFALTGAALMATALSLPASASTGCDQGAPDASVKASLCSSKLANAVHVAPTAAAAFAQVPVSHRIRSTLYRPDADYGTTGVSGGAGG